MKVTILLLFVFLFCSLRGSAQTGYSVKGAVTDTAANTKLLNTAISVLNAKDSTLVTFTRAAKDGAFNISNLHKGNFILLVTYPGYADYVEPFSLDSAKTAHDFGQVSMILKSKLLADVIIRGKRAAIKIKGDTTEFNAAAFTVQPNAKVEDLLKQLPGIQVDKDGKITAEGQEVKKVLVDGEEFFGDDPTLVTKNIRADMVDKVQLYDKKSDQAAFTGIDDGQKTKTINIKLKEDKKNGYFGKVEAGDGSDGYYEGQLLFNKFKAKQKFSAYATVGNNGKIGLGWQDNQTYGSSDNMQFGDNGEIYISGNSDGDGLDSFNGQYNGQGTPLARNGGLHYDGKWNSDKESINANYKVGSLEVTGTQNTLTQNNTPQGVFNTDANQTQDDYMFRQKLDLTYKLKLDTTADLKLTADGTLRNTHAKNSYLTINRAGLAMDTLLNTNNRSIDNHDDTKIFDASAFYTKKFQKKGRTLSFLASLSDKETTSYGYLKSKTDFYDLKNLGVLDSTQYIDQYKTADIKNSEFKTNFTYTEPLSTAVSMIVNYGIGVNTGTSDLGSFNPSAPGVYNIKVDSLSNNYKLNELSNQGGAIFNYKNKKVTINFGTKVSNVNFDQTDEVSGNQLKRDFVDWFPQANFAYRFSQQQGINLYYNGSTVQPTISQIQPIVVNTDPLNITLGNPNLSPSFTHRISMFYNSYKVITGQSIFLYGNYSITTNPIVSNLVTDTTGKTINQYFNLGSKRQSNYDFNFYFDKKIEKIDINGGINFGVNGNDSYNLSNNEINLTKSTTYNVQFRISKYVEKKYDFRFNFGPNYTFSGSSLQSEINNNGRGFDMDWGGTVYLPAKFQIGTDGSYQWRGKTETFNTDFNRTLLNASLAKTFLKQDNLKLAFAVNDLLNQNVGFTRNTSANFITQNTYSTIRRYFLLSISYDFNKMGGITTK
jgi:hypothetical protein